MLQELLLRFYDKHIHRKLRWVGRTTARRQMIGMQEDPGPKNRGRERRSIHGKKKK